MSKVVLFAASLLLVAGIATAGIINPCNSPVVYNGADPECYVSCPQGDCNSFAVEGFSFDFTIRDLTGSPIPFIPASDFWLIDCDPVNNLTLCGGSASSNANNETDANGQTTMSLTALRVGGCAFGLTPVCQGYSLGTPPPQPCPPYCFNVSVTSYDMTGNLLVDVGDLARFAVAFPSPPKAYDYCADFTCDGLVNVADLARFAFHFGPPGHKCI